MQVSKILGKMNTPQGNQVFAQLTNGRYAVGVLSVHSDIPADQQYEDLETALYKWYDIMHEGL